MFHELRDLGIFPPVPGPVRGRSRSPRASFRQSNALTVPEAGRWARSGPLRVEAMLRPESWSRLAGGSPVRVDTGVPGSRSRFVVETRRAERDVKSPFGGSKHAGRSVKRTLQPRHTYSGEAEPLMSERRPCPGGPVPGSALGVLPGYGGRHVCTVWAGTGETRLTTPFVGYETGRISRW
jgi:hypothetical protein